MKPVQLLLILLTVGLLFVYLAYFRSKLWDRVVVLLLLAAAWFSILLPEFTTTVANMLGVGRGADLIIYLFALFTLYALVLLYTNVQTMSLQLTALVRQNAIRDAVISPGRTPASPPNADPPPGGGQA